MAMIDVQLYLSDDVNMRRASSITGLDHEEIEELVGRFIKTSSRAGQLRGKVIVTFDGTVQIRHHFTNKLIWEKDSC